MSHSLACASGVIIPVWGTRLLLNMPPRELPNFTPPRTAGFFFYRVLRRHVKNIGCRRSVMHAVIRNYSGKGTKALFDLLEKNKGEVENLIRGVKGFVSYSLVRTTRGGFSVSVYQDKAGADESTRVAREWIAKNASKTGVARPTISERHSYAAIEVRKPALGPIGRCPT